MKGYKGFDSEFRCQGFQFEVGKTYEHEGPLELCHSGFHFCERPEDVLIYYPEGRFAEIEAEDVDESFQKTDSKRVCRKITILREITPEELLGDARPKDVKNEQYSRARAKGKLPHSATIGRWSLSVSVGEEPVSSAAGDAATAVARGENPSSVSVGSFSTAAAVGEFPSAAAAGEVARAVSISENSRALAAAAGPSGEAQADSKKGVAVVAGPMGNAECGPEGIAIAAGGGGQVRGEKGALLALTRINEQGKQEIVSATVGEEGIEPGVWYRLDKQGKFVPVWPEPEFYQKDCKVVPT